MMRCGKFGVASKATAPLFGSRKMCGGDKLSWKELRYVINRFPSCIEVVCNDASEEHAEMAVAAQRALYTVHRLWLTVTKCVKQLSYDGIRTPVFISLN